MAKTKYPEWEARIKETKFCVILKSATITEMMDNGVPEDFVEAVTNAEEV